MIEKYCKNCLFFIDKSRPEKYPSANWILEFTCQLHGSEARITNPESQFCGDENWVSVKIKTRIDNLEKLGI